MCVCGREIASPRPQTCAPIGSGSSPSGQRDDPRPGQSGENAHGPGLAALRFPPGLHRRGGGRGPRQGAAHLRSAIALDSGASLRGVQIIPGRSGRRRWRRGGREGGGGGAAVQSGQLCHGAARGGEEGRGDAGAFVLPPRLLLNIAMSRRVPCARPARGFHHSAQSTLPAPRPCPDAAAGPPARPGRLPAVDPGGASAERAPGEPRALPQRGEGAERGPPSGRREAASRVRRGT